MYCHDIYEDWIGVKMCVLVVCSTQKFGVLELVQSNLPALVRTCLLYGGRSTAHKVARLLALCLEWVPSHAYHFDR